MKLLGTILLVAAVACSDPAPAPGSGLKGDTCTTDGDCSSGLLCFEGRCRAICNEPSDCDQLSEHCDAGVCLPGSVIECGNGAVEPTEACDDGDEQAQDGCSAFCQIEPGWECAGSPSRCNRLCGNGRQDVGEECDDDNQVSHDGCSTACVEEDGFDCSGWPSDCETTCGDGTVAGDETCDDGDEELNDECPSGALGTCLTATCGDGFVRTVAPVEMCDDGNEITGDGCDGSCQIEANFDCSGSPSVCTCADGYIPGPSGCVAGCVSDPCGDHASCDDSSGSVVCTCEPFWFGSACDVCRVFVDDDAVGAADGSTWTDAMTDLQSAIGFGRSVVESGDATCEIWVAEGTYYAWRNGPGGTIAMRADVHVYGGFAAGQMARANRNIDAHPTILDGANPSDAGERVYTVVTHETGTVLDGFVIQRGYGPNGSQGAGVLCDRVAGAVIANCTFCENEGDRGGAVGLVNGADVTIRGCDFDGNLASREAGGIYVDESTVVVEDSTFYRNHSEDGGGAIWVRRGSVATVSGSTFVDNHVADANDAYGGAIGIDGPGGRLDVTGCNFVSNSVQAPDQVQGGAIAFRALTSGSVHKSTFTGNGSSKHGGAVTIDEADAIVQNCLFVGNTAIYGAGMYFLDEPTGGAPRNTVVASTFALHRSWDPGEDGEAIGTRSTGDPLILNSLFWRSQDIDINYWSGGEATIEYSLLSLPPCGGCTTGEGVVQVDPELRPPPSPNIGTWTSVSYDSASRVTTLTATPGGWTPGALVGLFVDIDTTGFLAFEIVGNGSDIIVLLGDRVANAAIGASFEIFDVRLSGTSPAIDAAQHLEGLDDDRLGHARVQATVTPPSGAAGAPSYPDIGCFEFVD